MPRPKRSWKDFDPSFFGIVEHFFTSEEIIKIPLEARQAYAQRTDFYRFKTSLREVRGEEAYARKLIDTADRLTITILPTSARGEEPTELVIQFNPLSSALARAGYDLQPDFGASIYEGQETKPSPEIKEAAEGMKRDELGLPKKKRPSFMEAIKQGLEEHEQRPYDEDNGKEGKTKW